MMSKRKADADLPEPHQIPVKQKSNEKDLSGTTITPNVGASLTIKAFGAKFGDQISPAGLIQALHEQIKAVKDGDLNRVEAMLVTQAHTLDAIFNELAQRAAANMGEYMNATDLYLRLALKAQSQCRATLETLAEIKFPKSATFVRQQNVGINQQVNNSEPTSNVSRARENSVNSTNKLLEQDSNGWQTNRLDTGTASAASGANRELEALGTLDRPSEQTR